MAATGKKPPCNARFVGVRLVWCSGKNGKEITADVQMDKVKGLIWDADALAGGTWSGVNAIPVTNESKGKPCVIGTNSPDSACCWWDPTIPGWVCPDEPT